MQISRRSILAGMVASVAVVMAPARAAEISTFDVLVYGPVFRRRNTLQLSKSALEWYRECVLRSRWQYDAATYRSQQMIRHPMTGLTYLISRERGKVTVQQFAPECCPCNEAADPDYIVGHAARAVAAHAARHWPSHRAPDAGPVYLDYTQSDWRRPYRHLAIEDGPPIWVQAMRDRRIETQATLSDKRGFRPDAYG